MGEKDHLSNDVSVKAAVEGKGISLSAKSRAVASFDRLLGGLLDVPAPWLEHFAEKKRLQGQIELEALKKKTSVDCLPEFEERQLQDIIESQTAPVELSKLSNKAKVVEKSLEHIKVDDQTEEVEESIDDDWLNYFEDYAEKASSERMQDV